MRKAMAKFETSKPNLGIRWTPEVGVAKPNELKDVEAPVRVELPTNGLGNWGFPLRLKWLINLRIGLPPPKRRKSCELGIIWQRIWQRHDSLHLARARD